MSIGRFRPRNPKRLILLSVPLVAAVAALLVRAPWDSGSKNGSGHGSGAQVASTCTIYESGADVRVTLTGSDADSACTKWSQELSGGGDYWTVGSPPSTVSLSEVCALKPPDSDASAIVEDSGSAINGNAICGALAHKGWVRDPNAPSVGPAEQSASDQANVDSAAASVSGDVDKLDRSTSQLASDWSSVQSSLRSLRSDLPGFLSDAAAAKSSHCDTFPDLPDSPDIGADSLLEGLRQLRSDIAQARSEEAAYEQAAQVATPQTPPPNQDAVLAAIDSARRTAASLTRKARAARSEANGIVNREQAAADATGC